VAEQSDFLVIGSGVAGMWFALQAAKFGRVAILTKAAAEESNSRYAQGGIAAVWGEDDDFETHVQDTLVAGAGLCRREAVEVTVREGPDRVRDLIAVGTKFTTDYSLHREGGHTHRRILHAADFTGQEIVRALHAACVAEPNIRLLDHHLAIDLVTESWLARRTGQIPPEDDQVLGAYVLDEQSQEVEVWRAAVVVLATGGAGKVYKYTTNPEVATGDGMAMAWRAGARIANMEFVQFHPTALFHDREHHFLISEALRGEGGKLVLPDGSRFMDRYDPRAELAPRDIVARAIDSEIKRRGLDCVYLDMRHFSRSDVEHKFPNIDNKLQSLGIDMVRDPVPVVPAAHYMCGGVQTDLYGESSVRNLFAVGEVSCTGLHGANRLASNSLLEAVVFAHRAAEVCGARLAKLGSPPELPPWDHGKATDSDEQVVIQHNWKEIRSFMWNYVGIVRSHRRLKRAQHRIHLIQGEVHSYYWDFRMTADLVELRNLITVADLIVRCALRRRESRGLHTILDFPDADPRFVADTEIRRWL
jgi:L-aspartate oxidase